MPDPRAIISGEDTGLEYETFKIDNSTITYSETADFGSAQAGVKLCVTLSADNTIALVDDGQYVLGRLETVTADLFATVAVRASRMKVKGGSGATLTLGKQIVGDQGPASALGYVREVAEGTAAELAVSRGAILDNDATDPHISL